MVKDQSLRKYGDHGADTYRRYKRQVHYAAYWAIRMLVDAESIEFVIPEGVEDLVILSRDTCKLYQIKTRDESRGAWTIAEVIPILCKLYDHKEAFTYSDFTYHFVSNQKADNESKAKNSFGKLYQLKYLLEILHIQGDLTDEEEKELVEFENTLAPKICQMLKDNHNKEVDLETAKEFLRKTRIETNCNELRSYSKQAVTEANGGVRHGNIAELAYVLQRTSTDIFTLDQADEMYERICQLLDHKIEHGNSIEERKIFTHDVISCRHSSSSATPELPDLSLLPGNSNLEKKLLLGGFDATELSGFKKSKLLSLQTARELKVLGYENHLTRVETDLIDLQGKCRREICQAGESEKVGPAILEKVRSQLPDLLSKYSVERQKIDELFCIGALWEETEKCNAWWHNFQNSTGGVKA